MTVAKLYRNFYGQKNKTSGFFWTKKSRCLRFRSIIHFYAARPQRLRHSFTHQTSPSRYRYRCDNSTGRWIKMTSAAQRMRTADDLLSPIPVPQFIFTYLVIQWSCNELAADRRCAKQKISVLRWAVIPFPDPLTFCCCCSILPNGRFPSSLTPSWSVLCQHL